MKLRQITQGELTVILSKHNLWLYDRRKGQRADFTFTDLQGIDFSNKYLSGADFTGASLQGANFNFTYLRFTDFTDSDITGATFTDSRCERAIFPEWSPDKINRCEFDSVE